MLVLRCTQKLLVRVGRPAGLSETAVAKVGAVPLASTTRLGDWYGNEFRLGRRQCLIFVSERTRLAVVVPAREARRLASALPDAVCARLEAMGVPASDIAEERRQMSEAPSAEPPTGACSAR